MMNDWLDYLIASVVGMVALAFTGFLVAGTVCMIAETVAKGYL